MDGKWHPGHSMVADFLKAHFLTPQILEGNSLRFLQTISVDGLHLVSREWFGFEADAVWVADQDMVVGRYPSSVLTPFATRTSFLFYKELQSAAFRSLQVPFQAGDFLPNVHSLSVTICSLTTVCVRESWLDRPLAVQPSRLGKNSKRI